jgi:hypothetical protein
MTSVSVETHVPLDQGLEYARTGAPREALRSPSGAPGAERGSWAWDVEE